MKSYQGKSLNIGHCVIGKIMKSSRKKWFSRRDDFLIYATSNPKDKLPNVSGYILTESNQQCEKSKTPTSYGFSEEWISELNEGDIVRLDKDGKVNILYEIRSHQNCILATNRCNLHCIMCPQPPSNDDADNLKMNMTLLKLMDSDKTKHLAITGGEPSTLGEGLFDLVRTCKEKLPKTCLTILTNGKKFSDIEFTRNLTLVAPSNMIIAMPIYSDDDQLHDEIVGVSGSFYKAMKGLHNLALFKHRIEIRTVVHALNYKRLPKLVEFIYRNLPYVEHVAIMGLEVTGSAKENVRTIWIDPYDYRDYLEEASKRLIRYNMKFSLYNHQLCTVPYSLWGFCRKSISNWKNIFLDECNTCSVKGQCGGFFETSDTYHSKHIQSIVH